MQINIIPLHNANPIDIITDLSLSQTIHKA
jgi:hypothetical protein